MLALKTDINDVDDGLKDGQSWPTAKYIILEQHPSNSIQSIIMCKKY